VNQLGHFLKRRDIFMLSGVRRVDHLHVALVDGWERAALRAKRQLIAVVESNTGASRRLCLLSGGVLFIATGAEDNGISAAITIPSLEICLFITTGLFPEPIGEAGLRLLSSSLSIIYDLVGMYLFISPVQRK